MQRNLAYVSSVKYYGTVHGAVLWQCEAVEFPGRNIAVFAALPSAEWIVLDVGGHSPGMGVMEGCILGTKAGKSHAARLYIF